MNREFLNVALAAFDEPEKWNAFLDLSELKDLIQKTWADRAMSQLKLRFQSDEQWRMEFGNWVDARWHFVSPSPVAVNFWLANDGNMHLVTGNEMGKKAELIAAVFKEPKYDPLRYVWGTDVQTNGNYNHILVKQVGKWYFDSPYDGDLSSSRLAWYVGNETTKYIDQIAEKVAKFKERPIMDLINDFQAEVERSFGENGIG